MNNGTNDKSPNKSDGPVVIFYSYSQEDATYRDELIKNLSMLRRSGMIREWYDREILTGDEWDKKIKENLEDADLILLLLSPDFLATSYCFDVEAARALQRHLDGEAVLVPILLRSCLWETTPFKNIEVLPINREPISKWKDMDDAYVEICEGLIKLITSLKNRQAGDERTPVNTARGVYKAPPKISQQRVLDAAFPEKIPVGKTIVLVVMIRSEDSEGLKKILRVDSKYGVDEEDVTSSETFSLDFPVKADGKPGEIDLTVKVKCPDFEQKELSKIIRVSPDSDSGPRIFILTALKPGELIVNLEVGIGETIVSECFFTTTAVQDLQSAETTSLKSIPLNAAIAQAAGNDDDSLPPDDGNNPPPTLDDDKPPDSGDGGGSSNDEGDSFPVKVVKGIKDVIKTGFWDRFLVQRFREDSSANKTPIALFSGFLILSGLTGATADLLSPNWLLVDSEISTIAPYVIFLIGSALAVFLLMRNSEMKEETKEMIAMTDWYNPWQLLDTAKKTLISTIIGENADPRLVGEFTEKGKYFDYSIAFESNNFDAHDPQAKARDDIWIDYVSDVGDGFNSTYSVAYSLAKETLDVSGHMLPRGEILIFGGDGVYPTATSAEYEQKLIKPYRWAVNAHRGNERVDAKEPDLKKLPHVFVLPGNHDWYDSLVSFQKIFCTGVFNKRFFADGWRTRQTRSYFALKLPQNWWLLGIDLQLSHNIDVPQLQYFESVVAKMEEGDKVILCVPEPYWVKAIKYQDFEDAFEKFVEKEESIRALEEILKNKKVQRKLYVAGDLHHYRRFESDDADRIQKITAGGGGAFLHPTHDFDYSARSTHPRTKSVRRFELKKNYPEADVSRSLDWKNLFGFMFNSPYFGVLTAILYVLLAWLIQGEIVGKFDWLLPLKVTVNRAIDNPLATVTVILMLLGLMFFTDSNSKLQKYLGGFLHGAAHLVAIFILGWLSFFVTLWLLKTDTVGYEAIRNNQPTLVNLIWFGSLLVICGIGGYVIGSFIMGIYLFISLHFFGRHDNEAFSALKIEDYKSFLRMHIDADGKLRIYPVKIEKVARRWKYVENDPHGFYEPHEDIKPEFIEEIKPVG